MALFTDFFPQGGGSSSSETFTGFSVTDATGSAKTTYVVALSGGAQLPDNIVIGSTITLTQSGTVAIGEVIQRTPGANGSFEIMLRAAATFTNASIAVVSSSSDFTEVVKAGGGVLGDLTGDVMGNLNGNVTGNVTGDLTGDVYSSNGTKVVENGTTGTDAVFTGSLTGNASTATTAGEWTTERTITLGGDTSGSVAVKGNEDETLTIAVNSLNSSAFAAGNDSNNSVSGTAGKVADWAQSSSAGIIPSAKLPNIAIGDVHTFTIPAADVNDDGVPTTTEVAAYLSTSAGGTAVNTIFHEGDVAIATGTVGASASGTAVTSTFLFTNPAPAGKTPGATGAFVPGDFHEIASNASSGVTTISSTNGTIDFNQSTGAVTADVDYSQLSSGEVAYFDGTKLEGAPISVAIPTGGVIESGLTRHAGGSSIATGDITAAGLTDGESLNG